MDVSAIILAGGRGTRMGQITQTIPKPLIKVKNKPLIEYSIDSLISSGINNIFVTISHLKTQWYNEELFHYKSKVILTDTSFLDSMISSFMYAVQYVNERFVIGLSSDVIFDSAIIRNIIEKHQNSVPPVSIFLKKLNNIGYKKWEWIIEDNKLVDIKISKSRTKFERYCLLINKEVIEKFTNNYTVNLGKTDQEFIGYEEYNRGWIYLLKRLCDLNIPINVFFHNKTLININKEADLKELENFLAKKELNK